jgi:hypothetical protein
LVSLSPFCYQTYSLGARYHCGIHNVDGSGLFL